MPFTPYHMAPGIAAKVVLRGRFSLIVFGFAQVITDVQPLAALLRGTGAYHGLSHTLVGATFIGAGAAVTGKYMVDIGTGLVRSGEQSRRRMRWGVAFLSAFAGSYSHLVLDSIVRQAAVFGTHRSTDLRVRSSSFRGL